jgi:RNA polymerase sigma-70 factor (ECF subfamily)
MARRPAPSRPDPDEDIRDLIQDGQLEKALRLLMNRYGKAIYRYCCHALQDSALADDVHQMVFLGAHRDLHQFRGDAPLRSWLFGIANNRVRDTRKSEQRKRRLGLAAQEKRAIPEADLAPRPDQIIDDRRLMEALADCVGELSPRVRSAVLLHYQQGLSFQEMAEVCGEKAGTLEARVRRALEVLQRCIERRTRGAV